MKEHSSRFRRWFLGALAVVLVLVGGLALLLPRAGASSTAPAYGGFHIAAGVVALALVWRGRPADIRAFLVAFGGIDLYQALASHGHWFPESLFRWTATDDRLHLAVGLVLVVVGAWPPRRAAG